MQTDDKKDEINVYRLGRLTVLELMAVLAVLGILATWVLRRFFA
ncbi:hypothetical protein AQUSIP_03400 [Aquicella siphonis]|uniref:Prepilin-type N-terminal cleavage/methylation domain-containing protein n=1 Tax=Aquicella siphonis TaxID=254247 RepID=A0A5E4PE21_9COXI|nr:prepilin-type N-terminal cleavage/methylation domain-containing protein [Aquicella siphonis]VVC75064.1 hypothetical protein AQUSIP_03400 [Aquicella siphonis]